MARHHRKSHRKSHRKPRGRKSHKRSHSRKQRGGFSSCAALPTNREAFAQRGGMAPYVAAGGSDYLLDAATRTQAQVGPLDAAFAELPGVIPRQAGGRRMRRVHHMSRVRKSRARKSHSRRKSSRRHSRRQSRRQHGGMYPISGPTMLLDSAEYAKDGTNPQFQTEGTVNSLYSFNKGPQ